MKEFSSHQFVKLLDRNDNVDFVTVKISQSYDRSYTKMCRYFINLFLILKLLSEYLIKLKNLNDLVRIKNGLVYPAQMCVGMKHSFNPRI